MAKRQQAQQTLVELHAAEQDGEDYARAPESLQRLFVIGAGMAAGEHRLPGMGARIETAGFVEPPSRIRPHKQVQLNNPANFKRR